jgi:hypothetical protein
VRAAVIIVAFGLGVRVALPAVLAALNPAPSGAACRGAADCDADAGEACLGDSAEAAQGRCGPLRWMLP